MAAAETLRERNRNPLEPIRGNASLAEDQDFKIKGSLKPWAGEMAQRLRPLPAFPEVLSSIPTNHMVAHNHVE